MPTEVNPYLSLLMAGTVALPSPFPATARVSVGVFPHDDGAEPEVYLKLVQVVNWRRSIVRIVRFEDVRAIQSSDGSYRAWEAPPQGARQLAARVGAISRALAEGPKGADSPREAVLFEEAIIYVPEASPVLHRTEQGLTAGESAEDYGTHPEIHSCCR